MCLRVCMFCIDTSIITCVCMWVCDVPRSWYMSSHLRMCATEYCICICVYLCVCVWVSVCVCVTYGDVMWVCMCPCVCTCMHVYACTHTDIHINKPNSAYANNMCTHACAYTHSMY